MSSGITFTNKEEAIEYVRRKQAEGARATLYKEHGKYVAYLTGELAVRDKKELITPDWRIPVECKDTDTIDMIYNQVLKENIPPKRTSHDIKKIVREELEDANVKNNIQLYVTDKLSLTRVAATNYPEQERQMLQMLFHPIHKYVSENYLRAIIRHEIEHIRDYNLKRNKQ